ncbi:rod shape-determining protein MreC [Alkanindiges illinoisensis]|uniref:rod shape-determining protein MreC n=1 Tax=Alkanindiges illinoisensis TaxID=197183 RepID=UPI00047A2D26|nr:rod shape-determining protein MreC [Alkanindiges illinoisensis]
MQSNIFSRQPPAIRSFTLALIACFVLIFINWRYEDYVTPVRSLVHRAFNPIYALASYPVLSGDWFRQQSKSEDQLRRENTAIRAELLQNRVRLQKLSELSAENTRLRGLLNTPLIIDGRMLISEVIGTDTDPLRQILIINKGRLEQVKTGQTILDDKGIMGQVIDVYPHSARVMLLSDKEHAISVRIERTGMRGIVAGTGDSGRLAMQYVPNTADIKVGDRLISSGLGEQFPAGYPVGMVTAIARHGAGEFASIDVKPLAQLEGGHHVVVLFSEPLALEQPYATS